MYEKVIIVGSELIPLSPSSSSTAAGMLRIYTYTKDGNARNWDYYISAISEGEKRMEKRREHMLLNMPTGTIYHLLGAAGIQSEDYDELFLAIQSGNFEHSFDIERRMESRAMQICRATGRATFGKNEIEVANGLLNLLIGRIVLIDWEQHGHYGRLSPHALQVMPSRDNGSSSFGGKTKDEWIRLHKAAMKAGRHSNKQTSEQLPMLSRQMMSMGFGSQSRKQRDEEKSGDRPNKLPPFMR